ncbi:MAG: ATP-binding protein [Sporomusaceae bacterium]|nr:ATP-binding protein [Sporomusaceae bacterium]
MQGQAAYQLANGEKYYRFLLNSITDAVFVFLLHPIERVDAFVDVNEAACKQLEFSREDLLQMNPTDICAEVSKRDISLILRKGTDTETVIETVLLTKTGRAIPVELNANIIDLDGQRLVILVARDISRRKKAEELLRLRLKNEQIVAAISKKLVCPIKDVEGRIQEVLRDVGEFAGADRCFVILDKDEGFRSEITHFWAKEYDDRYTNFQSLDREQYSWGVEKLWEYDYLAISSVGELPPEARSERQFMEYFGLKSVLLIRITVAGNIMGYLGLGMIYNEIEWDCDAISWLKTVSELIVNSVERKRFFEDICMREKEREALLNAIPDLKFRMNREGIITSAQGGTFEPFRPFAEQVGKSLYELFPAELAELYLGHIKAALTTGVVQVFEFKINTGENKQFREARIVAYNDEEAIVLVRDITRKRVAEQENLEAHRLVEQAQTMASLGVMATSIAHEINQPLNSIKVSAAGAVYAAREKIRHSKAGMLREFESIARQADRIDSIIKSIRALVKHDYSSHEPVLLHAVAERAIDIVANQPLFEGVTLRANIEDNLPAVRGNTLHFEQVIVNLLQNAAQSLVDVTGREKVIEIKAVARGGIVLEVLDNGTGISEEELMRIFEPFSSRHPKETNMGLGLAIVHNIVSAYNGHIYAYNNSSGGAIFRIIFPPESGIAG